MRLTVDQERQVQEIAGLRGELEKLKTEHKEEVDLLHTRVETLGKDKSALEQTSKYLQEKNKKLSKDHTGNSLVFSVLAATNSRCLLAFFVLALIVALCSHRTQKVVNNKRETGD